MTASIEKSQSNYQDFLKLLAIIFMLIDHLGVFFFPNYTWARVIGRGAMPLFCFFAGYNFKQYPKPAILIGAVILYSFNPLVLKILNFTNILPSIFIGQCYLFFLKSKLTNFNKTFFHVIILCVMWNCSWYFSDYLVISDYGTIGIAIMLLGYLAKIHPSDLSISIILSLILTFFYTYTTWYFVSPDFNMWHLSGSAVVLFVIYFLITNRELSAPIGFNLRIITRHSLLIYCLNVILFQTFLMYSHLI